MAPGTKLVMGAAVVTLLAGCGPATAAVGTPAPAEAPSSTPPVTPEAPPSAPPSTPPPAAHPTNAAQRVLPLYYVTDTPAGPRLAREFRRLPVDKAVDPGSVALATLFAAPRGAVPGHRSSWPAGTTLAAPVTHTGGVVTVDLTTAARGAGDLAVQQVVHTVTGALGTSDPVRVLVAGAPLTPRPVPRADPVAVRALVGIDEPAEGSSAPSPLRVTGEADVFEATLRWEVRHGGALVRSGTASTAQGQVFSPYAFAVALPPGTYEITVSEDDPSDGQGRPPMTDTRRVTVTG